MNDSVTPPAACRYVIVVGVLALFCGFFNLLPDIGGLYFSTAAIDGLLLVGMLWVVFFEGSLKIGRRFPSWTMAYLLACLVYFILGVLSPEGVSVWLLSFRNLLGYGSFGLIVSMLRLRTGDVRWCVGALMVLSTLLSAFGVFQFFFRTHLPYFLTQPRDSEAFSYFGTDILRANGLVGNTIVFASLMTMTYLVTFSMAVHGPMGFWLVASAVQFAAIVCTFSRMAMVASAVGSVAIVVSQSQRSKLGRASKWLVLGTSASLALWILTNRSVLVGRSFLVDELFGSQNASVQGSNERHREDVVNAIALIRQNPLTGAGVGTQNHASAHAAGGVQVVTDGFWWALGSEGGAALVLSFLILLFMVSTRLCADARRIPYLRACAIGLVSYILVQFGIAGFVNSGSAGKAPTVIFWILVGLLSNANANDECEPEVWKRLESRQAVNG